MLDMAKVIVVTDECFYCLREGKSGFEPMPDFRNDNGDVVRTVRCSARAACERRQSSNTRNMEADVALMARDIAENLRLAHEDIADLEARRADLIRSSLKEGASVTVLARAFGISRERVYQIRDGRR